MRVRYVAPISILVLFISLMPNVSHALSITIKDGATTLFTSSTLTVNQGTSGYISLANIDGGAAGATVGGLTIGTCSSCAGPARVSFTDGSTVDTVRLTDVGFTAITAAAQTGIEITFFHDFSPVTSTSYPMGAALNETFAAGNTATHQVTVSDCSEGCGTLLSRSTTDPTTGTSWNQNSQGTIEGGAVGVPRINGKYTITFAALNQTVRLPGSADGIFIHDPNAITFDQAVAQGDGFGQTVPEPSSLILLGIGLVALLGLGRKRLVA